MVLCLSEAVNELVRSGVKHRPAAAWLTQQLNGARRVGLPWQSLAAFLRIATHPRAFEHVLTIYSADTDFARFGETRWVNPVA